MISGPREPKTAERASILQSKILNEILICISRLSHYTVVLIRPVSERIIGHRDFQVKFTIMKVSESLQNFKVGNKSMSDFFMKTRTRTSSALIVKTKMCLFGEEKDFGKINSLYFFNIELLHFFIIFEKFYLRCKILHFS